jgi:hypothetical protein
MSPQEKNDCLLKEKEIFEFNQIPEQKAKILLAHVIEYDGYWIFFYEKNPSLFDRISNEWKTSFKAERACMLLTCIVDSFFSLLTIAERRAMLQSKIYNGECKIPIEKSLRVLDELSDDMVGGFGFKILKYMVGTDPDIIKGMPKEEFWGLPDEAWRKFHSVHKSNENHDTTQLLATLGAQIGDDQVAQKAFQFFMESNLRALINFFCDNHTKMTKDNAQRFRELSMTLFENKGNKA